MITHFIPGVRIYKHFGHGDGLGNNFDDDGDGSGSGTEDPTIYSDEAGGGSRITYLGSTRGTPWPVLLLKCPGT